MSYNLRCKDFTGKVIKVGDTLVKSGQSGVGSSKLNMVTVIRFDNGVPVVSCGAGKPETKLFNTRNCVVVNR